jgi:nicotinamidase-related amidase
MQHPATLELTRTALAIIDMQEAFRTKIKDFDVITGRIAIMLRAANILKLPVVITEQYPKGLGHTVRIITDELPQDQQIIEKTSFSSCGASQFQEQLDQKQIKQVLVCGIEAHICVNQTVHDLLANGYQVHLLTDCISSRKKQDRKAGFRKMNMSGAIPSSVEMALFELLRDARHEQFKAIQGLVK